MSVYGIQIFSPESISKNEWKSIDHLETVEHDVETTL